MNQNKANYTVPKKGLPSLMRYTSKIMNCMCDHTLMKHNNICRCTNKSNNDICSKEARKHTTATPALMQIVASFADILLSLPSDAFQGHSGPASGQPSVPSRPLGCPVIGAAWPRPLLSTLKLTGDMPSQTQKLSLGFYSFSTYFRSCFPSNYLTTS